MPLCYTLKKTAIVAVEMSVFSQTRILASVWTLIKIIMAISVVWILLNPNWKLGEVSFKIAIYTGSITYKAKNVCSSTVSHHHLWIYDIVAVPSIQQVWFIKMDPFSFNSPSAGYLLTVLICLHFPALSFCISCSLT